MTTVDEILSAQPGVRALAALAYEAKLTEAERERQIQLIDLRGEARTLIIDVLKQPEAVLVDLELHTKPFATGGSETVWFTLDGLHFRVRYESKKVTTIHMDGGFTPKHIYEDAPVYEVTRYDPATTSTWDKFEDLASLGTLLASYNP